MRKKTAHFIVIGAALLVTAGCASLEWRSAPQAPVIKELAGVKTIGVMSLTPVFDVNPRLMVKVDSTYYVPVEIDGVNQKVAMLHIAPDAASKFAANKQTLAALCRDVGVELIGDKGAFDYGVSKGFNFARVLGQPLPEVGVAGDVGYESVVSIAEVLDKKAAKPQDISALGATYGVEVVLALEPHVFGEIGKVSALPSESDFGKSLKPDQFILNARVGFEWVLFDAKTGNVITDSFDVRSQYDAGMPGEQDIIELGTSDVKAVNTLISGSKYVGLYREPMKRGLIPYLTLLRPVHLATLQEVKKEQ